MFATALRVLAIHSNLDPRVSMVTGWGWRSRMETTHLCTQHGMVPAHGNLMDHFIFREWGGTPVYFLQQKTNASSVQVRGENVGFSESHPFLTLAPLSRSGCVGKAAFLCLLPLRACPGEGSCRLAFKARFWGPFNRRGNGLGTHL